MTGQTFQLQPFPHHQQIPTITITGEISRSPDNQLNVIYHLQGAIDDIDLPASSPAPTRRWQLWESTCCELFIAQSNFQQSNFQQSNYWEVNLSPNHNWNVFALTDYRQGIQEASQIGNLRIITQRYNDRFTLETSLPLSDIVAPTAALDISATAVIQTQAGDITYWAIQHCGSEPDFHQRDSFALRL